jgi:uncharacterized membrane protein
MKTTRLEAFSDGVIAILITIMVLELKTPEGRDWAALLTLKTKFSAYILSFTYLAIYWNNHHHLLQLTERVNGAMLWANLHLLFWLSLTPFATAWMGDTQLSTIPTAVYGSVLLMSGAAFNLLERVIIVSQGKDSPLKAAVGADVKGKLSVLLYALAIVLAFWRPWVAASLYAVVAAMWLVPDPRIERRIA